MKTVEIGEKMGSSQRNFVSRSPNFSERQIQSHSQGHLHFYDEYREGGWVNLNPRAFFLREIEKRRKGPGIEVGRGGGGGGGRCDLGKC